MFLHYLGELVGEPDTDALADLPYPILRDWQEFMTMGDETRKGLPPDKAFELFRKMYGKK